jgi:hypothetical protein
MFELRKVKQLLRQKHAIAFIVQMTGKIIQVHEWRINVGGHNEII